MGGIILMEGGADISTFTTLVTTMLTWFLSSMTSITTWILGNPMAATYAAIFLVGAAVAMLFRVLHSV